MTTAILSLDYSKCHPEQCSGGVCLAVAACPVKKIGQEEQFSYPFFSPSPCKNCAKCVQSCPGQAIKIS